MDYTYSFIIPHHNSPELLNRCLDSIPQRKDIQIIVVDDNSEEEKHPVISRSDVQLITIDAEHSKWAGGARNYGLKAATGKWLLFADCDDFYENGFISKLDKYADSDLEMVFYNVYFAYDMKTQSERWPNRYSIAIERYLKKPSKYRLQKVKHILQCPWNFMVKRTVVNALKADFEEIRRGNDARFHHYVASNCTRIEVISDKLYYWMWNDNSLTHKKRSKESRLEDINFCVKQCQYRIDAGAWDTIHPFTQGLYFILKENGFFFMMKYFFRKLFCGIPWHKIWWHKLIGKVFYE